MFDAIVLAGGDARRLGGVDKPGLLVAGRPLLEHVLDAVGDAARIVVVGPARPTNSAVIWCREQPPGGGPVAALAAGLAHVDALACLLLAADLPGIAPAIARLLESVDGHDAAVLSSGGRRNYLAAAWKTRSLRGAVAALEPPAGVAARLLYRDQDVVEVTDAGGWGHDCDTWDDVRAIEEHR